MDFSLKASPVPVKAAPGSTTAWAVDASKAAAAAVTASAATAALETGSQGNRAAAAINARGVSRKDGPENGTSGLSDKSGIDKGGSANEMKPWWKTHQHRAWKKIPTAKSKSQA